MLGWPHWAEAGTGIRLTTAVFLDDAPDTTGMRAAEYARTQARVVALTDKTLRDNPAMRIPDHGGITHHHPELAFWLHDTFPEFRELF